MSSAKHNPHGVQEMRWTIRDGRWVQEPVVAVPRADRTEYFEPTGKPLGHRMMITPENDALVARAGF